MSINAGITIACGLAPLVRKAQLQYTEKRPLDKEFYGRFAKIALV